MIIEAICDACGESMILADENDTEHEFDFDGNDCGGTATSLSFYGNISK